MEQEESTFLTSDYTTNLQPSRHYGTSTKTEIQIKGQNRNPRDKSMHLWMDTLSLTKKTRIYNGEKTISLTSGAEKTGQPLVEE